MSDDRDFFESVAAWQMWGEGYRHGLRAKAIAKAGKEAVNAGERAQQRRVHGGAAVMSDAEHHVAQIRLKSRHGLGVLVRNDTDESQNETFVDDESCGNFVGVDIGFGHGRSSLKAGAVDRRPSEPSNISVKITSASPPLPIRVALTLALMLLLGAIGLTITLLKIVGLL
jgi:hypothetical protein